MFSKWAKKLRLDPDWSPRTAKVLHSSIATIYLYCYYFSKVLVGLSNVPKVDPNLPPGKLTCQPIYSRIVSLFAEQNDLMYAVPGGLIGVGTKVRLKYPSTVFAHLLI